MNSFLRDIEKKFLVLESSDYCESCNKPLDLCDCESEEIDEISTSAAVPGYQTPNAFSKADDDMVEVLGYKRVKESVNTPPQYSRKDERYQKPESEEEEYMDKFPFAMDEADWQHKSYEYPSKNLTDTPAQSKRKDHTVMEMMEKKYEQLIEGYRDFRSGDEKPSKKVKNTIREIAKKLREIETLVEYNTKLKTESGVTSSAYGPSTTKALTEISKRLIKISERVRSLGE